MSFLGINFRLFFFFNKFSKKYSIKFMFSNWPIIFLEGTLKGKNLKNQHYVWAIQFFFTNPIDTGSLNEIDFILAISSVLTYICTRRDHGLRSYKSIKKLNVEDDVSLYNPSYQIYGNKIVKRGSISDVNLPNLDIRENKNILDDTSHLEDYEAANEISGFITDKGYLITPWEISKRPTGITVSVEDRVLFKDIPTNAIQKRLNSTSFVSSIQQFLTGVKKYNEYFKSSFYNINNSILPDINDLLFMLPFVPDVKPNGDREVNKWFRVLEKKYILNFPLIDMFFLGEKSNIKVINSAQSSSVNFLKQKSLDLEINYNNWFKKNKLNEVIFTNQRIPLIIRSIVEQMFIIKSIELNNIIGEKPSPPIGMDMMLIVFYPEKTSEELSDMLSEPLMFELAETKLIRTAFHNNLIFWSTKENIENMTNLKIKLKIMMKNLVLELGDVKEHFNVDVTLLKSDLKDQVNRSIPEENSLYLLNIIEDLDALHFLNINDKFLELKEKDFYFLHKNIENIKEVIALALIKNMKDISVYKDFLELSHGNTLYKGFNIFNISKSKFSVQDNYEYIRGFNFENLITLSDSASSDNDLSESDFTFLIDLGSIL
jgi:hypothetical protein